MEQATTDAEASDLDRFADSFASDIATIRNKLAKNSLGLAEYGKVAAASDVKTRKEEITKAVETIVDAPALFFRMAGLTKPTYTQHPAR